MTSSPIRHLPFFRKLPLLTPAIAGSLLAATSAASADAPSVVTTIKPLHSIASAVMAGVGEPHILIDGAASPHGFALKPSQAFLLQGADVVFWIGPNLAPSLAKPISSMASDAEVVEMMEAPGLSHLDVREGANFDAHDHDHGEHGHEEHAEAEHGHDDHDHEEHAEAEHAHDDHDHEEHAEAEHDHDDPGHEEHAEAEHGHDGHEHEEHAEAEHDHEGALDPHIWLNPDNGIAIAAQMAATLAKVDPDNAATYKKNAQAFSERIEALENEIEHDLEPAAGKKFIVFHDAYHHFEHHFDIEASGAVTLSPEALSSADRIEQIRDRIRDLGVTCVFQEPQFEAKLVKVVLEGSDARTGTLDPLGTQLDNGPELYPGLLKGLSDALTGCLNGGS